MLLTEGAVAFVHTPENNIKNQNNNSSTKTSILLIQSLHRDFQDISTGDKYFQIVILNMSGA